MATDLSIEIFAYKWFHRILLGNELLSLEYDATKVYEDECLAYPESNEVSDCEHLYYAIMFRRFLFGKLYLEEIQKQINEFRYSQADFHCYVLRTCNRIDLFSNLTIFERVFATCAFICCLCLYCCENGYSEIMRYGDTCWAIYFDNIADEFYKQGGWNRLKMVAVSYKSPIDFVDIMQVEDRGDIILIKLRNAIKSYQRFKKIGEINYDECISMSWVKFYSQYLNGSSDNDFDEFFEEIHSKELENYIEVEEILKQLKYLCDPNGSEIVKYLGRKSSTDSLERSMGNLNICDKYVSLESKEERRKIKHNSDSAVTFYRKKDNKILYDSKKEECEWKRIEEANKNKIILNEQMSSTEDDAEKKNKNRNDVSNKQDEWKVKGTERNTSPSRQITPRKNAEKGSSDEAQNDTKEQDKQKSTTIPASEKNTKKKNSNKILKEKSNNQDECKTIKGKQKSTTTRISFSKRRVKKENSNKNHQDIGHEQGELKDKKDKKDGQMSSTGKNAEEENIYENSIQEESIELKNFLRMLLVLGDNQGMSYVMKTS